MAWSRSTTPITQSTLSSGPSPQALRAALQGPARSRVKSVESRIRRTIPSRSLQAPAEKRAAVSPRLYPTTASGAAPSPRRRSATTVFSATCPKIMAR